MIQLKVLYGYQITRIIHVSLYLCMYYLTICIVNSFRIGQIGNFTGLWLLQPNVFCILARLVICHKICQTI